MEDNFFLLCRAGDKERPYIPFKSLQIVRTYQKSLIAFLGVKTDITENDSIVLLFERKGRDLLSLPVLIKQNVKTI
jgi:hypothetical protein